MIFNFPVSEKVGKAHGSVWPYRGWVGSKMVTLSDNVSKSGVFRRV